MVTELSTQLKAKQTLPPCFVWPSRQSAQSLLHSMALEINRKSAPWTHQAELMTTISSNSSRCVLRDFES